MTTITAAIEERARQVARERPMLKQPTPISILRDEVAFFVEQVDRMRDDHRAQLKRLVQAETVVDTELMQLEGRENIAWFARFSASDRLKGKLLSIDAERRHLIALHQQAVAVVHEKLLHALAQYDQLHM